MKFSWSLNRPRTKTTTQAVKEPSIACESSFFDLLAATVKTLGDNYHLATVSCAGDRMLSARPGKTGGARLITAEFKPNAADTIIACTPHLSAQTAFLILPNGERITTINDGFCGPAISFRLMRVPDSNLVEFRHPIARARRVGIVPQTPRLPPFRVLFDRVGDPVLDRFELAPVSASEIGPAGRSLLHEIALVAGPPLDAAELLAALEGGKIRIDLAEALLRLLPTDQIDIVARRAMDAPDTLTLLQKAMPSDPWIMESVPDLIAWRGSGRPKTRKGNCDATQGYVAIPHGGNMRPQAGLFIQNMARRTVSPRRNAAILATMREEGAYLVDWIAYHRAIGFEHIVIYTNDNRDGSDELLDCLSKHGIITWVENELGADDQPQTKAYGHALKRLPDLLDYRWTMILDADEYVGFDSAMFPTVHDYIAWQEHQRVDAIALRWLMFSARPHDAWSEASTIQRFTWRDPDVSTLFKTMIRTNMFSDSHAHFPFGSGDSPFVYRWDDGTICYHMAKLDGKEFREPKPTARLAWTAHYPLRGMSEMLDKVVRGDAWTRLTEQETRARMQRLTEQFFRMAHHPNLVEDRRMLPFSGKHQAERARIEGLPGVGECSAALRRKYARKMARINEAVAALGKDIRDVAHHDALIARLREQVLASAE